jgi:hypothetical protein
MCGCEGFYVCARCAGTPAAPLYVDDEPREPQPERDEASFWLWVATMRAAS